MTISVNANGTKNIVDLAGNKILNRTIPLKLAPFDYISDCIYIIILLII